MSCPGLIACVCEYYAKSRPVASSPGVGTLVHFSGAEPYGLFAG